MKLIAQEGQGAKQKVGLSQAAITPGRCIPSDGRANDTRLLGNSQPASLIR